VWVVADSSQPEGGRRRRSTCPWATLTRTNLLLPEARRSRVQHRRTTRVGKAVLPSRIWASLRGHEHPQPRATSNDRGIRVCNDRGLDRRLKLGAKGRDRLELEQPAGSLAARQMRPYWQTVIDAGRPGRVRRNRVSLVVPG
jgi:hypothetical protein